MAAGRLERVGRWVLGAVNRPHGAPLRALPELEELFELEREFEKVSGGRRAFLYPLIGTENGKPVRYFIFTEGYIATDVESAKRRLRQLIAASREGFHVRE